jgi:hypothetical protein
MLYTDRMKEKQTRIALCGLDTDTTKYFAQMFERFDPGHCF